MIEFSRIKKITIKEGIVKKITNSSGVVLWKASSDTTGDTSSVTVDLNNQWVASTKKLDGYLVFMSNSNKGVSNGYASMKIKFKGKPDFKIWINSYAESSYDYTIAFNMDVDFPTSNPSTGSIGVKLSTYDFQKDPTTIDNFKEVDYPNDGGEHFVVITYRKDGSGDVNDDRGYVAIKVALLSTTWVLSSTEFIKENDKYYQRINEIETYEGGITAPTGNFKKGNELTPTYIQSSDANDYMLVGAKMYYKKYAWITPVDTAINTGDYIQGDYIGEATPSMKVTYIDDSNKTFYNLTSIGENTDANKSNAKSVEIYDGVSAIGNDAFLGCENLTGITIPNSVTSIGYNAFARCSKLTGITIPNSVTSIDYQAFQHCSKLTNISLSNNLTKIGSSAFYNCSSLTGITIPNSVAIIDNSAFSDCSRLTGITIPDSVTIIGYGAFGNCSSLTDITIPYGVTSIDDYTFYNCSSLTGITIPDSVTSIGNYSFKNCKNLTGITIPDGVTRISNSAFSECSNLASVTIENSDSKLAYKTNAFFNISSTAKLYVQSNLLADYQADTAWTGSFPGGIYAIGS